MVKFVRFAIVTVLRPIVVEKNVRVRVSELLIVSNAVAITGAVIIYVKKLTKDLTVNVNQDLNKLESSHVKVCSFTMRRLDVF